MSESTGPDLELPDGCLTQERIEAAWRRVEAAQQDETAAHIHNLIVQQRDLAAYVWEMLAEVDDEAHQLGVRLLLVAIEAFRAAHPGLKRVRRPALLRRHESAWRLLEQMATHPGEEGDDSAAGFSEPLLMGHFTEIILEATPEPAADPAPDQPAEARLQLLHAMMTVVESLHEATLPSLALPVMKRKRRS